MTLNSYPLVSIVTPAYNQAQYLEETIQSVLNQDYPNIEYIVLDDGSTDNTREILKRYDGKLIWQAHENMGQANTLNRGWKISNGSLLGYLSSDDRLEPTSISKLVNAILKRPDAVVSYGDFQLIDEKGQILRIVETEEFCHQRLTIDLICQPGPGALFRREIFDQLGGWIGHLRHVPDFEFWLRASKLGTFVRVPEVLADYRVHDSSASFMLVSSERSAEIVDVMKSYWQKETANSQMARSISTAHLIAAKSHFHSGRLKAGFLELGCAIRERPRIIFLLSSWRMVISGFIRRNLYKVLFCLK